METTNSNNALFAPLETSDGFKRAFGALKNFNREGFKKTVLLSGVVDSQKRHVTTALANKLASIVLYVASSELKAREALLDMSYFTPKDAPACFYPGRDIIFSTADVRSADILKQRLKIIDGLLRAEPTNIVLSIEALFDILDSPDDFKKFIYEYEPGDVVSLDELTEKLIFMGYKRVSAVEAPGQFAVRGGILDLFCVLDDNAVRLEFFGDEIDSIRLLDAYSQRSIEKLNKIRIFPMRECVGNEGFVSETPSLLFDYLPKDTLIVFDDPQRIRSHAENTMEELKQSIQNRVENGDSETGSIADYEDVLQRARLFRQIVLTSFMASIYDFKIDEICGFEVKSTEMATMRVDSLIDDLTHYKSNGYTTVILCGGKTKGERIMHELTDKGFSAAFRDSLDGATLQTGVVTLSRGSIGKGFEYPALKFAVLDAGDLFEADKKKRRKKKREKGERIGSLSDLSVGDYVVHDTHGIGIYGGIEKINVDMISRDYLKITYAGGGVLYVQTAQMDMLQKYIGSEEGRAKLSKLGGSEWQKAKSRAKGAAKIIAEELAELYAKRQASTGFNYGNDTVWQTEFEEMFPFDETDDQLAAIEDVKRDMESEKVMDRLICGDVGYGKTEIAIRAAFKAVQGGKQTAFLVPTTILAQQHYNTFVQRMKDYPVNVALLSRFRTPAQQKATIDALGNGEVDIVVGTHKLLNEKIKYKNLGLIVVDEEQRFGVTHKEKLKKMRENIDVLTLTATPIPRTLHMSLTGIRDMSILEEPPEERRPIQTYVMEYNPEAVRDAIHRELARNGQVFFLHNRVRNISEIAAKLQQLVPEATVSYAHGQMAERDLEEIMMDFIDGEINVLVCTTIIEAGLDIPNVNTIIVQDADRMGLAQLYQLRGRVGRSNRLAYAYLMYKKDKVLTELSEKRLQAIREFTEFGSGFKVAMRDLEIRGAGNLLGAEQHGHMDAIGYDMYCRLLMEAVNEHRMENGGELLPVDSNGMFGNFTLEDMFETQIDVAVNAYIPPYFIEDEEQKLEIYKKISMINSEKNYYDVQEEIEDRFGDLPLAVTNLLDIALLKAFAHNIGATSVVQKSKSVVVKFKPDATADPLKIAEEVKNSKGRLLFTVASYPYLTYKTSEENDIGFLKELTGMLARMG